MIQSPQSCVPSINKPIQYQQSCNISSLPSFHCTDLVQHCLPGNRTPLIPHNTRRKYDFTAAARWRGGSKAKVGLQERELRETSCRFGFVLSAGRGSTRCYAWLWIMMIAVITAACQVSITGWHDWQPIYTSRHQVSRFVIAVQWSFKQRVRGS